MNVQACNVSTNCKQPC